MDENSVKRLAMFKECYPEEYEKLVIIDEPLYYELEKQYADDIPNWEYKKRNKENERNGEERNENDFN